MNIQPRPKFDNELKPEIITFHLHGANSFIVPKWVNMVSFRNKPKSSYKSLMH